MENIRWSGSRSAAGARLLEQEREGVKEARDDDDVRSDRKGALSVKMYWQKCKHCSSSARTAILGPRCFQQR